MSKPTEFPHDQVLDQRLEEHLNNQEEDAVELAVCFGKEGSEECYIKIVGVLDQEFFEELQELMETHKYTDSL